ncbi:hypothetical protein BTO06_01275 [Tenacibaculum sp. SZ-18]|uniref:hypothetical protein n=1 Tax=Tenacibaculum sp. SZ-18 TaxID=754423 RepID=UPI000C2CE6BB|nr:hypothetical protein [Tenacibaculum sp. SZ-18]AUC13865.1 hypothetical protein BTO06_01275 [Tenacibaculum sp. SZ-18]
MFKYNKKVSAGALQYVLVIGIIILIILLSFIQFINLQQKLEKKRDHYGKAILNTANGFKFLSLNSFEDLSKTIQFSDNANEETTFVVAKWGVYDLVKVTSKVKNEEFSKIALMGSVNKERKSIYLVENNTPLVIVGKTRIIGNAYLPRRGVKRGNISGVSYYGDELVYGAIRTSSSNLPENRFVKRLFTNNNIISESDSDALDINIKDQVVNSYISKTLVYKDYLPILLEGVSLKGNIIIQSFSKIVVAGNTSLEDVILIAPEIEVKSGTKGSFQAFASKRIIIEKNVKLTYPSCLVLKYDSDRIDKKDGIFIDSGTYVSGGVYFLQKESNERNLDPQIKINTSSVITGELYCQGNTEILGTVIGELYTNNFIAKQNGRRYINHIYNGVMNARELSDNYIGILGNDNRKGVSKWLY